MCCSTAAYKLCDSNTNVIYVLFHWSALARNASINRRNPHGSCTVAVTVIATRWSMEGWAVTPCMSREPEQDFSALFRSFKELMNPFKIKLAVSSVSVTMINTLIHTMRFTTETKNYV
jgi:hypothetical protein